MSQNKLTSGYFWGCTSMMLDCQVLWNTLNRIQCRKIPKSLASCESHKSVGIYWISLKVRKIGNALARPRFARFREITGLSRLSRLARFPGILRYWILFGSEFLKTISKNTSVRRVHRDAESMSCDRSRIRVQPLVCEHRNGDLRTLPVYSFTVLDEP